MSEHNLDTLDSLLNPPSILDKLDDELRDEFWGIVNRIETDYKTYLDSPESMPQELKEGLEGVLPEDFEAELARACVVQGIADLSDQNTASDEDKRVVNEFREIAFNHIAPSPESQEQDGLPELTDEFKAEMKTELHGLADAYATKLAKESDRSLGQLFHELSARRVKEDLSDMMGGIATILSDECDRLGASKEQRDQLIEQALQDVTDRVVSEMADARLKDYEESSTAKQFVYKKWEQWNGEGFRGKLKKGAVFAFAGIGMGAVIAPLAGAVAGAGIIGTATAISARSLLRGLASSHLDNKSDAPRRADLQNDEIIHALKEFKTSREKNRSLDKPPIVRGASSAELLGVIDKKVEKYRKRNRNRILGGTAIAMSAGLVSGTLADFMTQSAFAGSPNGSDTMTDLRAINEAGRQDMGSALPANLDTIGRQDMGPAFTDVGSGDFRQDMGPAIGVDAQDISNPTGRGEMFNGYHGTRELTPQGQKAILKDLSGHRVKAGESLWSLSERALEAKGITNPTVYEIDATKDMLLSELNHSSAVDAKGMLQAGAVLRFPG